ncbi:hypothetical protein ATCC90586_009144 [Pythium insidiosum]|nr:hypothetical protein ATCC90586_009144 [Pythium insidiosum]
MASSMESQAAAVHASLSRNLLSSVLALALPDHLASDASAQESFIAQGAQLRAILTQHDVFGVGAQLRAILTQHDVFGVVTDGKAFDKFHAKLFELVDQASVGRDAKATALELLAVVVEQCPMEQLEALQPKLMERVLKMVKYVKEAPRVVAAACRIARLLVRHIEFYAPESRRALFETLTKLLPAVLAVVTEASTAAASAEDKAVVVQGLGVFTELLLVSPSSVRSSVAKLESAAVQVFFVAPLLADDAVVRATAECLASIANASDKLHQTWKQIVDRVVEMAHLQIDCVAGKRTVTTPAPTGMKTWLADALDDADVQVYHRAATVVQRLALATRVLEQCLASRTISEREVQLVLSDVIALTRRVVTVRANEVGKQSAVSEDGFRLPSSVVYGVLPEMHALGLRVLTAAVRRAGLCALRHASKITRTLSLAVDHVHSDTHAALYEAVAVCVKALGASTLEKVGQPLLEQLVRQCKQDLADDTRAAKKPEDATSAAQGTGKGSKGKKRKRQAGDLSQLSSNGGADGAGGSVFLSARNRQLLVKNVDAALAAIATIVAVYGGLLPSEARSTVSETARLAVQQQTRRRRAMASDASAVAASPLDVVAMLLLSDAVSADQNGAHATSLVSSLQYWGSAASAASSPLTQLVALNVAEALVHPRAPPLVLNFDHVVAAHTAPKGGNNALLEPATALGSRAALVSAPAVRGRMDWDDEGQRAEDAEMEHEPEQETTVSEELTASKRAKTKVETEKPVPDVEMAETEQQQTTEEDVEEDFDDERPVVSHVEETSVRDAEEEEQADEAEPVASVSDTPASATNADDDDDDEFPDIVVDDADE